MKRVRQRTVNSQYGDCFAACIASLLELPLEVIPNDHSPSRMAIFSMYLGQFGLELTFHNASGPIWSESPWIASVESSNYEGGSHAILMQGQEVLFDPSTRVGYKKGTNLLGERVVFGGYIIRVSDFSKLHKLDEYRKQLNHTPEMRSGATSRAE